MLMSGLLMLNLIDITTIKAVFSPSNITNLTIPTLLKQGDCCSVRVKVPIKIIQVTIRHGSVVLQCIVLNTLNKVTVCKAD